MKQPVTIAERLQATAAGDTDVADRRDIQAFLSLLFKPEEIDGLVFGLWTEPGRRGHWFAGDELNRAAGWALAMSRQEPVFLRPTLARKPRIKAHPADVAVDAIVGLWLQVSPAGQPDTANAAAGCEDAAVGVLLDRFPLRPTLVLADDQAVILGWLFQLPWVLEGQGQRGLAEQLQQRFAFTMKAHATAAGVAGDVFSDLSIRLPLPCTLSRHAGGRPAVVFQENDCRYAPEDFWPHLAEEVIGAQERSAAIMGDEVVRLMVGTPMAESPDERAGKSEAAPAAALPLVRPPRDHDRRREPCAGQISNFILTGPEGDDSDSGLSRRAVSIEEIGRLILEANGGWPRRIGRRLFVPGGNEFRWLNDHAALFAWIQSNGKVRWADGADDLDDSFVTRAELMAYLEMEAPSCAAVSLYPWAPTVRDAWSGWQPPAGYVPAGAALNRFLESFCPATPRDASLLRAMFLTYVWGGLPGQRPLFVVTGARPDARGIGRTQCLRTLADVVGGAVEVSAAEPGMVRNLEAGLTLPSLAHKRVVVVDEFPGVLLPQAVARWVDAEAFEGPGDGASSFRRPNLVTWCVAARSDKDVAGGCLSDRAVVIRLAAPDRDDRPGWLSEIRELARDHRDEILADAVAALTGSKYPISGSRTRFAMWCEEVLATDPHVDDLLAHLGTGAGNRRK